MGHHGEELVLQRVQLLQLREVPGVFPLERHPLRGAVDDEPQGGHVHRFLDEVVGAQLDRLDGALDGSVPREDQGKRVDVLPPDVLHDVQPALPRHVKIGEDDIVFPRPELVDGLLAAVGAVQRVAVPLQGARNPRGDLLLVVHHQNAYSVPFHRSHRATPRTSIPNSARAGNQFFLMAYLKD